MRRLLHWLMCLFMLTALHAHASPSTDFDVASSSGEGEPLPIDWVAADRADLAKPLTWDAAPTTGWAPARNIDHAVSIDRRPRWIAASLVNHGSSLQSGMLQVSQPFTDEVRCLIKQNGAPTQTLLMGDAHPFKDRRIDANDHLLPISIPPGARADVRCLLANDGALFAGMSFWHAQAHESWTNDREALRFAIYGALAIACLMSGLLALIVKDRIATIITLDCMPVLLGTLSLEGDAFRWFWPDLPELNIPPYHWILMGCAAQGLVLRMALSLMRRERWVVDTLIGMSVLMMVAAAITRHSAEVPWAMQIVLSQPVLVGLTGLIICLRKWHDGLLARVLAFGLLCQLAAISYNSLGLIEFDWVVSTSTHFYQASLLVCLLKTCAMTAAYAIKARKDEDERKNLHQAYTLELCDRLTSEQEMTASLLRHPRYAAPNLMAISAAIREHTQQAPDDQLTMWVVKLNRVTNLHSVIPYDKLTDVIKALLVDLNSWLGEALGREPISAAPHQCVAMIGTETLVFCTQGANHDAFAQTLQEKLLTRFEWQGLYIAWDPHIGYADLSVQDLDGDLMSKAWKALLKCSSHYRLQRHDASAAQQESLLQGLSMDLIGAIDRSELELHYQPKVSLEDRSTHSVEALVRWRHPQKGLIPPGSFISEAEATGAIHRLTIWAIREAAQFIRKVEDPDVKVAVNVSAFDLATPGFSDEVLQVLREVQVPTHRLIIEVTESVAVIDTSSSSNVLNELRAHGMLVALDDFGSGYSSLGMLSSLPIDEIKIDRSLLVGAEKDAGQMAVLRSAIDLGRRLGKKVTVEGVESFSSVAWLTDCGCHIVQGYVFSRPLPEEQALAWLMGASQHIGRCPDGAMN